MNNLNFSFNKINLKINWRFLNFGKSPEADWEIIFISSVVLALLAIGLSVFTFLKIDRGEIFVTEQPTEQIEKTLDISKLRETVSYYQNKAQEFERISNTVTSSSDPSL